MLCDARRSVSFRSPVKHRCCLPGRFGSNSASPLRGGRSIANGQQCTQPCVNTFWTPRQCWAVREIIWKHIQKAAVCISLLNFLYLPSCSLIVKTTVTETTLPLGPLLSPPRSTHWKPHLCASAHNCLGSFASHSGAILSADSTWHLTR